MDKIIHFIINDLISNGCEIQFVQNDSVKVFGNEVCKYSSGYFDDTIPLISISVQKDKFDWFCVLVHEYCHFLQWCENDKFYNLHETTEGMDKFDDWLSGVKKITKRNKETFLSCLEVTKNLELNCEQRAIDFLKKFKLSKSCLSSYIKKANSYLFFYEFLKKYHIWYDNPPFEIPEIFNKFKDSLYDDYSKLSEEIEILMKKFCYN